MMTDNKSKVTIYVAAKRLRGKRHEVAAEELSSDALIAFAAYFFNLAVKRNDWAEPFASRRMNHRRAA